MGDNADTSGESVGRMLPGSSGTATSRSDGEVPTLPWPNFDSQTASDVVVQPDNPSAVDSPATTSDLPGKVIRPHPETLGRYRYDIAGDSWWWSDELYRMYGFAPGSVVPTGALILAHTHPDDFEPAAALLSTAIAHGGEFSLRHRMIDADGRIHTVVSVGEAVTDISGTVTGLAGFVSDLTHSERLSVAHAVSQAVADFMARRTAIEQAKGVLRGKYGCDSDEAFALMKWRSQHSNIKVRDVANRLLDALSPLERDRSAEFDGFEAQLGVVRAFGRGHRAGS